MLQIVFVHGVNVRDSDEYKKLVEERDKRFKKYAFKGNEVTIQNPYWGQHGANPKFNLASIPGEKQESLAMGGLEGDLSGNALSNDMLITSAKANFMAVVNSLSLSLDENDPNEMALSEALVEYALDQNDQIPLWLNEMNTDDDFLERLQIEAQAMIPSDEEEVDLGIGAIDLFKKARQKIVGGFSNLVNGPAVKGTRAFTPQLVRFIGDVFSYLKDGDLRTKIRQEIESDILTAAQSAQQNGEKLVLIGHSMGGVILYDMLSDPEWQKKMKMELNSPLQVDLFISIGSQPGLFEELNLFQSSVPGEKGEKPVGVDLWWNIYDRVDILSFAAEKIFNDVVDLEADTIAGILQAHNAYLKSQVVLQKLHRRMKDAGIIT